MAQILHDLQRSIASPADHIIDALVTTHAASTGRAPEGSAHTSIFAGVAAATQHFEALGRILRKGDPLGAPVLALTRSAIEAMGRSWYLMGSEEGTMAQRDAALQLSELRYVKPGESLWRGADRSRVEVAQLRAELDAQRGQLAPPNFAQLSKQLIGDAKFHPTDEIYSRLSGGAHGETATTYGLHVSVDGDDGRFMTIGLPSADANLVLALCVGTSVLVIDRLTEHFGADAATERWRQDSARIRSRYAVLRQRWEAEAAVRDPDNAI